MALTNRFEPLSPMTLCIGGVYCSFHLHSTLNVIDLFLCHLVYFYISSGWPALTVLASSEPLSDLFAVYAQLPVPLTDNVDHVAIVWCARWTSRTTEWLETLCALSVWRQNGCGAIISGACCVWCNLAAFWVGSRVTKYAGVFAGATEPAAATANSKQQNKKILYLVYFSKIKDDWEK